MSTTSGILVIAACSHGDVNPETYDLLAFARILHNLQPEPINVLVVGEDIDGAARQIARRSGVSVTAITAPGVSNYVNEAYRGILGREIQSACPAYVCAAHTSQGAEWAPAVAVDIGAACISAVDGVSEVEGRICFQKDLYGGKVKGRFAPLSGTAVVTVQPGIFNFTPAEGVPEGIVNHKCTSFKMERTRFLGVKKAPLDTAGITDARIVVAAGNGIGDQDNMELIHRLARMLPQAVVAGSRIVCDRGWLAYHRQVGVTGTTVAPALYIACGISGASQHVMGMRGSGFVIAINTDTHAPIFNEADIGIVEDITQFIPLVEDAVTRSAQLPIPPA